jgi:two-component system sensor histidine kinase MtrB
MVFDRFWRADPARARTTGGTGLGLAISLEDARLHNGWLQAWGECGKGSVFRLTVPRMAGQELVGSPLPLGPDEAEPGPELILAPLPLRVSQLPPGSGLTGAGFPGTGFAGSRPAATQHMGIQNTGIQNTGIQNTGTGPEGPGGAGATSDG